MKQFYFLVLISIFLLTGCSTNYYLVSSDNETPIYSSENSNEIAFKIAAKKQFIIYGKQNRRYTYFGTRTGYAIYSPSFKTLVKLTKKQAKKLPFSFENGYSSAVTSSVKYKGSTSSSTGGTVSVKGYTRKDGTYVKPHTRSAPRKH